MMRGWARALLIASMLGWTGLTASLGVVAARAGSGDTVPADAASYVAEAAQESEAASVDTEGDPGGQRASQATATPRLSVRTSGRAYPVPEYALPGGVDPRIRPAGRTPPREPQADPPKGVIVLDPGHGRGDPGATHYLPDGSGRWDITEANSNLRNAELIRDELERMGYAVYLTRDGEGRGPGRPLPMQFIVSDLFARVALAQAVDADVYVAIHGNGARVKSISGPETWYCGKHEQGSANERLATVLQQAMMDGLHEYGYDPPDRGIKEDAESHHSGEFCQFVVTRETAVPSALIEFLFLSNDEDARVLVDDRSHVLLAKHMAAAIDGFLQERAAP
ncbi:MAG: N-acetylmuramoyl-L-alanine amidase [Dehalococcoidia bacterium]